MHIKAFLPEDIIDVKKFTDEEIGLGYYSLEELTANQEKSIAPDGTICSFVLVDSDQDRIKGLRLAFPPGSWDHGKGSQQRADLWPFPVAKTGYFQSLFLAKDAQGQGWGPQLSEKSIVAFKKLNSRGVATHSWKQSPNNSSIRYLEKLGFKKIAELPLYWFDVDYTCSLDGKPCRCTAVEMYLTL